MDDLKQSLKKVLEERIASPLFGYISLALILGNWRPLTILFMGKDQILERLVVIDTLPEVYWQWKWPLLGGVVVACLTPYLHLLLQVIHQKASDLSEQSEKRALLKKYQTIRSLANEKASADSADEIAMQRQKTRAAILEARRKKIENGVDLLIEEVKSATKNMELAIKNNNNLLKHRIEVERAIKEVFKELQVLDLAGSNESVERNMSAAQLAFSKLESMPILNSQGESLGKAGKNFRRLSKLTELRLRGDNETDNE